MHTAIKFKNSQIYQNCRLWYSLNYSTYLEKVIVHIFKKVIIRKIFPNYMDPITSTGWGKNVFAKCFCLFLDEDTSLTSVSIVHHFPQIRVVVLNLFICIFPLYYNLYIYVYPALVYYYCVSKKCIKTVNKIWLCKKVFFKLYFWAKCNLKQKIYIVVIWLSSYSLLFFLFTFQCFSSVCFLLFLQCFLHGSP